MGRRKKTEFEESLQQNNYTYMQYYYRLMELSLTAWNWTGLPDTVDSRFLELTLFGDGQAVFFQDDVMGFLALQVSNDGQLNVYRVPSRYRAYAVTGYNKLLNDRNSVIVWNNYLHMNSVLDVMQFARRLYELDRIIDVNAKAQKTPVLVTGTEQQRLSLLNLYMKYDGNEPVIFGDKNLDISALKSIDTKAPYVADKIYQLKTQIWNEALTYLGIANVSVEKKERLVADEVERSMGGTLASRRSRLKSRQEACEKINDMFGLDIWCKYAQDIEGSDGSSGKEAGSGKGTGKDE